MARVIFLQPAIGTMMANTAILITAGLLLMLQTNTWFDDYTSNWSDWGLAIDPNA